MVKAHLPNQERDALLLQNPETVTAEKDFYISGSPLFQMIRVIKSLREFTRHQPRNLEHLIIRKDHNQFARRSQDSVYF